ncbi:MAG: hypothetical protein K0Q59_1502 [Paenibacillus sp.]|jgi:HD-GYP domain-containing protein (c-di-GMP phosphodiesterase class II)|nr:hypothetical protein [Paenibacillus sp.]
MPVTQYDDLVGKRLLHNVASGNGMMLIPEDSILTEAHIEKLEKFNIDLYDIHVAEVEALPEQMQMISGQEKLPAYDGRSAVHAGDRQHVRSSFGISVLVKQASAKLNEIEQIIITTGKVPVAEVSEHVLPTLMEATQNRNVYKLFADLRAEEDFRFKHSIGVAFMSALLGRWLGMDEQETALLTTAASLCDVGTIRLPGSILHKTDSLLAHETEIMKQHTKLGYDMLVESGVEQRIARVALQHHEREDGSGYPAKLRGDQIDRFGKIVAIADVYMAMASDRPQRPALPFYQVLQNLHSDIIHNRLDSGIGMTFLNRLMSAQVGSDVLLTNGQRGRIVLIHPNYPTQPLIALESGFIDLSKTDAVHMKEIFG